MIFEIDHAYMHTGGSEKVDHILDHTRFLVELFSERCQAVQLTNIVFHIQQTKPIDLIDFWTSEVMGAGEPQIKTQKMGKIERDKEEIHRTRMQTELVGNRWYSKDA